MTIIPLRHWAILMIAVGFLSGCAAPKYTQRQCLIGLVGQTDSGHVLAKLFCEPELPYDPETGK